MLGVAGDGIGRVEELCVWWGGGILSGVVGEGRRLCPFAGVMRLHAVLGGPEMGLYRNILGKPRPRRNTVPAAPAPWQPHAVKAWQCG